MRYILLTNQEWLEQIAYIGVTEEKIATIHQHKHILKPLIPKIVNSLYAQIEEHAFLREIIDKHTTIERLNNSLVIYISQCFEPIIDDAYINNRLRIGHVHSKVALPLKWYVSTFQKLIQILQRQLEQEGITYPPVLIEAVQTLFFLDISIVTESYNRVEFNKAANPLKFEVEEFRQAHGFGNESLRHLDLIGGYITFYIDAIIKEYQADLFEKIPQFFLDDEEANHHLVYIKKFLNQFFQERIYTQSEMLYRVVRDWARQIIDNKYSKRFFQVSFDTLSESIRKVLVDQIGLQEQHIMECVLSVDKLCRLFMTMISEIVRPYLFLRSFQFLDMNAYEISTIDFGRLTWIDEKLEVLLKNRTGLEKERTIGKRCYEVLYDRTVPCPGCPAMDYRNEEIQTAFESENSTSFYKVRPVPQSHLAEISRSLLVMQDVTKESRVIFNTMESLLQLAEFRDDDTGNHVQRIGILSSKLAQLAGMNESFVQGIKVAARFHDIGKVGIPDSILKKPGKLTSEEWESMKTHSVIGFQILSNMDLPSVQMAASIAETHHEWWNGNGYPRQLKGEEIPVEGRIVAIVDVFDALLSKRSYKEAFSAEIVKSILLENKGKQFDPTLVDLFLTAWSDFVLLRERLVASPSVV